jgi:hypothetical protein
LVIRRPAVCRLNDTRAGGSRPMLAKRFAGRCGRSLQPSRQSMCQRHRKALAWPWLGTGLAPAWLFRDARTRRIKFNKLPRKLRPAWRRSRTQFAHSRPHNQTAKNRFALSFLCHSGPANAAPRASGT